MNGCSGDVSVLLSEMYATHGNERYMESVTMLQHSLQTASLASREHAVPSLVVAALLHDVGHFLAERDDVCGYHAHAEAGARYLESWFGQAVTEPVRLHVPAKRYLSAREAGYFEGLSAASIHSLQCQGGIMDGNEAAAFEQERYFAEAVRLRRWDDKGKQPGLVVAPFSAYEDLLRQLAGESG